MTPHYSKIHNRFQINGMHHHIEGLVGFAYDCIKEGESYDKTMGNFFLDWLDDKEYIEVNTSGSTGPPKRVRLMKQSMVNSAIATGDYFNLHPGDTILHCLPSDYIAGKMMLVRAMILGLEVDLTAPTSQPIFDYEKKYDFCAMVPLQLQNTYQYCKKIKTIIVGGASVPSGFLTEIKALKSKIYGTYGMTETITHIAVKPLNDAAVKKDKNFEDVNSYYKALPNVRISQDERDCLVLEVPYLFDGTLTTNDIVSIQSEDTFELLGRYDNVINSGGIKFHPEKIQDKLSTRIDNRFFITSEKDADLGEKIVLILEAESNTLNNSCFDELDKYEMPKAIYAIPKFVETKTGKIDQAKTLELLK